MNKRGPNFNKVVNDFKSTLSYAETGRINNLSRQRVEHIIKKSGVTLRPKLGRNKWVGKLCKSCSIPLTRDNHKSIYCLSCYYRIYNKKRQDINKLNQTKEVNLDG